MSTNEKTDVEEVEVSESEAKEKKCFIITPIGNSNDVIFRHINGVIQSVIRPVLECYGFSDIRAAHEMSEPGSINNQIVNRIINDDLVIANLTEKNPNVMYELCLRHVAAKPVIHICEEGTNLPFDIKGERTIFYTNDMYGVNELKNELIKAMDTIDYEKEYKDNPIYTAVSIDNILKDVDKQDGISLIIKMLENVTDRLSANTSTRLKENSSFREKYIVSVQLLSNNEADVNEFLESLLSSKIRAKRYLITDVNLHFQCFKITFNSEQEMLRGIDYLQEFANKLEIKLLYNLL